MTRKQDRYATQAQHQTRIKGKTVRGNLRTRSRGMQMLLAASIGSDDFTPADLVRHAHRLRDEGQTLAQRGLSPQVKAMVEALMKAKDLPF